MAELKLPNWILATTPSCPHKYIKLEKRGKGGKKRKLKAILAYRYPHCCLTHLSQILIVSKSKEGCVQKQQSAPGIHRSSDPPLGPLPCNMINTLNYGTSLTPSCQKMTQIVLPWNKRWLKPASSLISEPYKTCHPNIDKSVAPFSDQIFSDCLHISEGSCTRRVFSGNYAFPP